MMDYFFLFHQVFGLFFVWKCIIILELVVNRICSADMMVERVFVDL